MWGEIAAVALVVTTVLGGLLWVVARIDSLEDKNDVQHEQASQARVEMERSLKTDLADVKEDLGVVKGKVEVIEQVLLIGAGRSSGQG